MPKGWTWTSCQFLLTAVTVPLELENSREWGRGAGGVKKQDPFSMYDWLWGGHVVVPKVLAEVIATKNAIFQDKS